MVKLVQIKNISIIHFMCIQHPSFVLCRLSFRKWTQVEEAPLPFAVSEKAEEPLESFLSLERYSSLSSVRRLPRDVSTEKRFEKRSRSLSLIRKQRGCCEV